MIVFWSKLPGKPHLNRQENPGSPGFLTLTVYYKLFAASSIESARSLRLSATAVPAASSGLSPVSTASLARPARCPTAAPATPPTIAEAIDFLNNNPHTPPRLN